MSLIGVEVGDTVRVLSDKYDQPAMVVKVGRTLATLSDGHQYEIASGQRKPKGGVVRGWGFTAHSDKSLRMRDARGDLRGAIARLHAASRNGSASLSHLSEEALRSMAEQVEALAKRVENKNG